MDIKENLLNRLTKGESEKIPVTAFPSVLTMELLYNARTSFDEANHNPEKMAEVAGMVYKQAGLEAITIPLDLWFESESFGYRVERAEGQITPKVKEALYTHPEDIVIPDDYLSTGQFPTIEKAAAILHEKYDDLDVPLIGEITGAFTILTDLVDMKNVIKMLNSDYFEIDDALDEINTQLVEEVKFYQEIGVDVIVVNDPSSTSKILKPDLYEDMVQPYLEQLHDAMNVPGILHICGDTKPTLEHMLNTGYEGISISQEVEIEYAVQLRNKLNSGTRICGNIAIGETLLLGSREDIISDSIKCIDSGVDILGPSCNIAYETPLKNIRAMVDARDEYYG